MKKSVVLGQKGFTLIELLIGLVISVMVVGGIYNLFVAQSKAYVVQDQVVEMQQGTRGAMEILLRDLRIAGFDYDQTITPRIDYAIVYPYTEDAITLNYEYYDTTVAQYQKHTVAYWRDAATSRLIRQLTVDDVARPAEILQENVDTLIFTYGVDANEDGTMDDQNGNGRIDDGDWVSGGSVDQMTKVVAVRVLLTARPAPVNPDIEKIVTPRTLTSAVTLRNQCLVRQ